MSSETLTIIAAAILSLAFSYIPGLSAKYQALAGEIKRLIMLCLLVATTSAIFGIGCADFGADLGIVVSCDKAGAIGLIKNLVFAIMANQTTFAITPNSQSRK